MTNSSMLNITSQSQLFDVISDLLDDTKEINFTDITFDESLLKLKITLIGEHFNDTITGQTARGLWEFQQEVYRAVAFTLYGKTSIRALSKEDIDEYNIVFKVDAGSTDLTAWLKIGERLTKEALKGMSPRLKFLTVTSIVAIITTGVAAWAIKTADINSKTQTSLAQINKDLEISKEQEKTKQFEIIKETAKQNANVETWLNNTENGFKSIAKTLDDGDEMNINDTHLDADVVRSIKQKSPRTLAEKEMLHEEFTVYGQKQVTDKDFTFEIRSASGEFTVKMDLDSFTEDEITQLRQIAAVNGKATLSIQTVMVRDKIKDAFITDFFIESSDTEQ